MIKEPFFAPASWQKDTSLSRENAFISENISPPGPYLRQLQARSRLSKESFSSSELNFFVGEK